MEKPPINRLQELVARVKAGPPIYDVTPLFIDKKINFKCVLTCLEKSVTFVGSSKKEVKRLSAQKMLELLQDLPVEDNKKQTVQEYNPIGELQEYCVKNEIVLPKYETVIDRPAEVPPQFKIKCICNGLTTDGEGNSKKGAKRTAAVAMLALVKGNGLLKNKEKHTHIKNETSEINGSSNGETKTLDTNKRKSVTDTTPSKKRKNRD